MARPGTLFSFSGGRIPLTKHSVLLAEALHAASGCLLLSFAEVLMMKAVAIHLQHHPSLQLPMPDHPQLWGPLGLRVPLEKEYSCYGSATLQYCMVGFPRAFLQGLMPFVALG